MKVNKLTVDASQSQAIVFLSPKSSDNTPHFNVMMNQEKISCSSNLKYLRLFIDEHLDVRKHLTCIEAKLARAVGILYKCKAYFSTKILRMLYFSLIYPHLTHSIIVWGSSFKCDVKKSRFYKIKHFEQLRMQNSNKDFYLYTTNLIFYL